MKTKYAKQIRRGILEARKDQPNYSWLMMGSKLTERTFFRERFNYHCRRFLAGPNTNQPVTKEVH